MKGSHSKVHSAKGASYGSKSNPRGSNTGKSFGNGMKAKGNSRTRQVADRFK